MKFEFNLLSLLFFSMILVSIGYVRHGIDYPLDYDRIAGVADTGSMGLTLNERNALYEKKIGLKENLTEGDIYVYKSSDEYIVHRLIVCLDNDCNMSVFKGDNNHVGEIVNRTQIKYKVVGVIYR